MPSIVKIELLGETAVICLNRPKVHNAVDEAVIDLLEERLNQIEANDNIRTIILTGAGNQTFCAGGDIRYFAKLATRQACLEMSNRMQAILERFYSGKRVVIAAVNGRAIGGGCEILTACHIRLAASGAVFAFRQAANGIITGWGGGKRLLRQIGKSRALRLLLTGESIDARTALQIGLIDQIVERQLLTPTAIELAEKINGNSQAAVEGFLDLARHSETADWENIKKIETEKFADLWMGEDFGKFIKRFLA